MEMGRSRCFRRDGKKGFWTTGNVQVMCEEDLCGPDRKVEFWCVQCCEQKKSTNKTRFGPSPNPTNKPTYKSTVFSGTFEKVFNVNEKSGQVHSPEIIAGCILGGIVLFVIVAACLINFWRKRKNRQPRDTKRHSGEAKPMLAIQIIDPVPGNIAQPAADQGAQQATHLDPHLNMKSAKDAAMDGNVVLRREPSVTTTPTQESTDFGAMLG